MARLVELNEVLRHLKIPSSQIKRTGVELGNGSYGKVYEVDYSGKLCAAKEIHSLLLQLASTEGAAKLKDDFLRECHIWSTLRHPNVVQFLGTYYPSTVESGLPVMDMEKMQDSVTSLIEKHDNIPLLVKLSILHDVSLGLRYLHDHDPVVIHRDLSPNNILVASHLEAKITDLGVAKAMMGKGGTKTLTKTPGTGVFMPPEALDDKPVYGPPLDVFSFGGVILYVTSRQWPTPKSWSQIDPKTKKRILLSEVERRQQYIDMMSGGDADLKPLVTSCLEDDPESRPSVIDISERLKTMKELYSKKTTHDGMNPVSWLASLSTQLQRASKQNVHTRPRNPTKCDEVLFAVGGWCSGHAISMVERYNPHLDEWKLVATMTERRCGVGVTVLGDFLYAIGGHDGTSYLNSIERYDPKTNQWSSNIAPINTCRTSVGVAVLDNFIYAVGGQDCVSCLSIVEKYDPKANRWTNIANMNARRLGVAVAVLNNQLYVVGGSDETTPLNSVERYDPKTNHWTSVEPMKTKHKHLGTAVLDNLLYAIGGRDENTELNSVEKYDPTTNQWSSVLAMNYRRSGVGLAVVNGHLYAVGGFDGLNYLKSVEWFDPATNQWKIAGSMNYSRLGGGVGVLKLPETS